MVNESSNVYPVVLSGGRGSRLWPLSSDDLPKQFHSFGARHSLFQQAVRRIMGHHYENPVIVCGARHRTLVAEHLAEVGVEPEAVLMEPVGRNTATSCCLAALSLQDRPSDTVMMVFPSDHMIEDTDVLRKALDSAVEAARDSSLALLGVSPAGPVSDYGYVTVPDIPKDGKVLRVERFVEKPHPELARSLIAEGRSLWNSGIYVVSPTFIIEELERWAPQVVAACRKALDHSVAEGRFFRVDETALAKAPAISIDRAVAEKTDRAVVVPLATGWSDLGTWRGLWEALGQDQNRNVGMGNVEFSNSSDCFVYGPADGARIHVEGQDGAVVVSSQENVYVTALQNTASSEIVDGAFGTTHRPWGSFRILGKGLGFQVKEITVDQEGILSLQRHRHRSEIWTILEGRGRVTRDEEVVEIGPTESIDIPVMCVHRLENVGVGPLRLVELQLGSDIRESDIERLEDRYGRARD